MPDQNLYDLIYSYCHRHLPFAEGICETSMIVERQDFIDGLHEEVKQFFIKQLS